MNFRATTAYGKHRQVYHPYVISGTEYPASSIWVDSNFAFKININDGLNPTLTDNAFDDSYAAIPYFEDNDASLIDKCSEMISNMLNDGGACMLYTGHYSDADLFPQGIDEYEITRYSKNYRNAADCDARGVDHNANEHRENIENPNKENIYEWISFDDTVIGDYRDYNYYVNVIDGYCQLCASTDPPSATGEESFVKPLTATVDSTNCVDDVANDLYCNIEEAKARGTRIEYYKGNRKCMGFSCAHPNYWTPTYCNREEVGFECSGDMICVDKDDNEYIHVPVSDFGSGSGLRSKEFLIEGEKTRVMNI